jgi:hypothetical protein
MRRLACIAIFSCAVSAAAFDWDPFYESLVTPDGATFEAWRPLYSTSVDGERWRKDYLWPLYTKKGFKQERYGRFLFFGYSADFSPDTDRHRVWVLPFYFKGTSAEDDDYRAFFPFGGTIYEFLGRDKLSFVLFPIYMKYHINDIHTTSVLWPIGSKTTGPKVERFRIWPLYGKSTLENEFEKKFVLWPIYNSVKYTNERNPGGGFILVPIYGRIITEQARNYWWVAPFFRYTTSDEQWIVHAPWPFIQLAGGEMYKRIFWPIYGKKQLGPVTNRFVLWPIIWNNETEYIEHRRHRRLVVPFFASVTDVATKPTHQYQVGDVSMRYWKLWPLMSWERNEAGSRFRTLEFWPLRNTAGIERNWAAFWTLYRREKNYEKERVGHHLLWGLYRQTREPDGFEWSLLKGLAGYKKSGTSSTVRFLFMKFGGGEEQP